MTVHTPQKKAKQEREPLPKLDSQRSPASSRAVPVPWSATEKLILWRCMLKHMEVTNVNWDNVRDEINAESGAGRTKSAVKQHWPYLKKDIEKMWISAGAGQRGARTPSASARKRTVLHRRSASISDSDDTSEQDSDAS